MGHVRADILFNDLLRSFSRRLSPEEMQVAIDHAVAEALEPRTSTALPGPAASQAASVAAQHQTTPGFVIGSTSTSQSSQSSQQGEKGKSPSVPSAASTVAGTAGSVASERSVQSDGSGYSRFSGHSEHDGEAGGGPVYGSLGLLSLNVTLVLFGFFVRIRWGGLSRVWG